MILRAWKRPRKLLLGLLLLSGLYAVLFGGWLAPDNPGQQLRQRYASTRLLDRHGTPLRAFHGPAHTFAREVALADISPHLIDATVVLEDKRFYQHVGVDPIAVVRAIWGNLTHLRVTSGASTLTQQVVKMTVPRPRRWLPKIAESIAALHLETKSDKQQILTWYLNYAPYGGLARGAEQASQLYFGKTAADLTVAEAAYLAVLPRSPTRLDPLTHAARAIPDQQRLLYKLRASEKITHQQLEIALKQPIVLVNHASPWRAPHFADWVAQQLGSLLKVRPVALHTTLDGTLQTDVQAIVAHYLPTLADAHVDNAAVVVLDSQSAEVLCLIGSRNYIDVGHLGANNGALALRQPGSTMKAFTYALAFDRGQTPATLLPDLPAHFATAQGDYAPQNYGHAFMGPVRARLALGNSVNIAAVRMLEKLGVEALQTTLQALGFASLAQQAQHYGLGLTLGDGEVTLLDLTAAYATLARGGAYLPPSWLTAVDVEANFQFPLQKPKPVPVFSAQSAWLVSDILRDPRARALAFGRDTALELPFAVAAKTGTSKGFRDNWAIGYSPRWTVGVWVGNFDGSAMHDVSGVTGAAPLMQAVFLRLAGDQLQPNFGHPAGIQQAEICPLSGDLASPLCPESIRESFKSPPPTQVCQVHQNVAIDVRNGLRAGANCPQAHVRQTVFAVLRPEYAAWSRQHLPQPPDGDSPLCPADLPPQMPASDALQILQPHSGAVYYRDSLLPDSVQVIDLVAVGPPPLHWFVDGVALGSGVPPGQGQPWNIRAGAHRLEVRAGAMRKSIDVFVRAARER